MQKHRLVKFLTKTTCENGTQELRLDPKIDSEERETPQPSVLSTDLQTGGPQSPEDDGEKHPRVTPQASSSGKYHTRERNPQDIWEIILRKIVTRVTVHSLV